MPIAALFYSSEMESLSEDFMKTPITMLFSQNAIYNFKQIEQRRYEDNSALSATVEPLVLPLQGGTRRRSVGWLYSCNETTSSSDIGKLNSRDLILPSSALFMPDLHEPQKRARLS